MHCKYELSRKAHDHGVSIVMCLAIRTATMRGHLTFSSCSAMLDIMLFLQRCPWWWPMINTGVDSAVLVLM